MQITEIKEIASQLNGLIPAFTAIIAVIVTSFFNIKSTKLNINFQEKQKNKELKTLKLEELFYLFEKWQINFSHVYLLHLRCYRGLLEFEQTHIIIKDLNVLAPGDAQKYKVIMAIHFPSLENEYEPVEAARKLIVPFLSDPKISRLSAQDFERFQILFENSCSVFKSKITSLAHTISKT